MLAAMRRGKRYGNTDSAKQAQGVVKKQARRAGPALATGRGQKEKSAAKKRNEPGYIDVPARALVRSSKPNENSHIRCKGAAWCEWATLYEGANAEEYIRYHDEEWGRPVHDDNTLFEFLVLEGAQAGLSWHTILQKRAAYRRAFKGFDIATVAAFTDSDVDRLLRPDSGIVRHKGKISSAVSNARIALKLSQEYGSLASYLWSSFVPNGKPIVNTWAILKDVPTTTAESEHMSKVLKKEGFKFVGPTTCYSFMQAVGMVNDHITSCFCYKQCALLGREEK